MLDLSPFQNLPLRGGFTLVETHLTADSLLDPMERTASAQTTVRRGKNFHILLRADLDAQEISISLYHEVLEAATVASINPPAALWNFNEGDFEQAAQDAHRGLGFATPESLNQMLAMHGFSE